MELGWRVCESWWFRGTLQAAKTNCCQKAQLTGCIYSFISPFTHLNFPQDLPAPFFPALLLIAYIIVLLWLSWPLILYQALSVLPFASLVSLELLFWIALEATPFLDLRLNFLLSHSPSICFFSLQSLSRFLISCLSFVSLQMSRRLRCKLLGAYWHLQRGYQADNHRIFAVMSDRRAGENGHKLLWELLNGYREKRSWRDQPSIRKDYWGRLCSLHPQGFSKTELEEGRITLVWSSCWPCFKQGVGLVTSWDPYRLELFCHSKFILDFVPIFLFADLMHKTI